MSAGVDFGFRGGPTYRASTPQEMMAAAFAQPMNLGATFFDQAKGGLLESSGAGTALRDLVIPQGNTEPSVMEPAYGMALAPIPGVYPVLRSAVQAVINQPQPSMTENQYKGSRYYRPDIPYDPGMTEQRAAALADWNDAKKVREYFATKRPITSFVSNLAGQAVDPVNYIDVIGPMVKLAAVARFGRVAGTALVGAGDAAINTGIADLATRGERGALGDDISWETTVSQMATAALIGGAFGGVFGGLEARSAKRLEQDLSTLKTTQEARAALNEAIGAVVRGEDLAMSPSVTGWMGRVADEADKLSKAYDEVKARPTGNPLDPLISIAPEDIDALLVARGAFKDINEAEFSKSGRGLVKVIWGHGEKSSKPDNLRVTKDDIVALPTIVREFEPVSAGSVTVSGEAPSRTWRVERDGRVLVYGDKEFEGGKHLVTVHVLENPDGVEMSRKKAPALRQGPEDRFSAASSDTAEGLTIGDPGARRSMPATTNIARRGLPDNSMARPAPLPASRKEAEVSVAKAETYKSLADQYRVDPETGAFPEEADLKQIEQEGRLTEEDRASLDEAQKAFDDGIAFGEALKAAVACLI